MNNLARIDDGIGWVRLNGITLETRIWPGRSTPILLIQGLDDEYGTMDQFDRIEAVLPDTKRLELAAPGHPHAVDAVNRFLRTLGE